MSEPWAVSKVAHRLTPEEDINEDTRTDVLVIDDLLARCIARLITAIRRDGLPGFDGMQAGHICEMLSSMKWTHNSIRELLRLEVHPSSVDGLALVRLQLEALYSICHMLEKPSSVNDYVKSAWKKAYCRFLLDREEHIHLPRFQEFYETRADREINSLQIVSGVTAAERATIEFEELGTPLPAGITKTDIKAFPTPAGVIRGTTDPTRKAMLLRMYPEYKHLSSSVHGSPLVSLFKTAFDRSSRYRDNCNDAQRRDILDQQVASLSIMLDFLSVVQSCTEYAPFYRADVDLIGVLTESWNVITRGSLLGAIIWNLRSKQLLGVL
jgi:hypothetical protein